MDLPSSMIATETAKLGVLSMKARVPSIGSTTKLLGQACREWSSFVSSESQP